MLEQKKNSCSGGMFFVVLLWSSQEGERIAYDAIQNTLSSAFFFGTPFKTMHTRYLILGGEIAAETSWYLRWTKELSH